MSLIHQDWKPVILKKAPAKKPKTAAGVEIRISAAIRHGTVEIQKRVQDVEKTKSAVSARALDAETTDFKHAKVSHEFKVALMQARVAKKMTQTDLAKAVSIKASIVQDYESGKAIPAPAIIAKFNRALGVTLPRNAVMKKVNGDD